MSKSDKPKVQWQRLVTGASAGAISATIVHPLDLLKIRFQVNEGTGVVKRPFYFGMIDALKNIKQRKGYLGLFQGVTPNFIGSGSAWGLYFLFYNTLKQWRQDGDLHKELPKSDYMLLAALSSSVILTMTNPIWIVKTRLCLQYDKELESNSPSAVRKYKGIIDCLRQTFKQDGIRGLYKGYIPGLFGTSHGAVQFMTYESLKNSYSQYNNQEINMKLSKSVTFTFGALSKLVAVASTYPYQVLRSRLQDQHRSYNSIGEMLGQMWRHEGIGGFYKGLCPSLIRVVPASGIIFMVEEYLATILIPSRHD